MGIFFFNCGDKMARHLTFSWPWVTGGLFVAATVPIGYWLPSFLSNRTTQALAHELSEWKESGVWGETPRERLVWEANGSKGPEFFTYSVARHFQPPPLIVNGKLVKRPGITDRSDSFSRVSNEQRHDNPYYFY